MHTGHSDRPYDLDFYAIWSFLSYLQIRLTCIVKILDKREKRLLKVVAVNFPLYKQL